MTRWARKVAAAGGKALKSTPWEEMAAGPAESEPERKSKRKKTYQNEDVNGFAAYLKQAGNGRGREEEEEAAVVALKKDRRRENRRLRRQEARKNAMVSSELGARGGGGDGSIAALSGVESLLRIWFGSVK